MCAEEFFQTTPRFFSALMKRHERAREMAGYVNELMIAQVIAAIHNTGFRPMYSERVEYKDFLPVRTPEAKKKARTRRRTNAQIADEVRATMKHFGISIPSPSVVGGELVLGKEGRL